MPDFCCTICEHLVKEQISQMQKQNKAALADCLHNLMVATTYYLL